MALRDAPILVLGAGGIGGTIAARLCARGAKVTLITRNPDIAHAIAGEGLRAQSHDGDIHIARPDAVPLVDDLDERHGPFGLCILAVPPSSAQTAVEDALPVLTADAPILCCPNGLIEERLSTIVDPERVVGGIVTFAGSMLGPGNVQQTSNRGGIMLGRLPNVQRDHDPMFEPPTLLLQPALPDPPHRQPARGALEQARHQLRGLLAGDRRRGPPRGAHAAALRAPAAARGHHRGRDPGPRRGHRPAAAARHLDLDWLALTRARAHRPRWAHPSLLVKHTVLLPPGPATARCAPRCCARSSAGAPRRSTSSTARSPSAPAPRHPRPRQRHPPADHPRAGARAR